MPRVRHRFYVQAAGVAGTTVVLPVEESAHAARVLRLRPGAEVGVFDGRGHEYVGTVARVGKQVEVHLGAEVAPVSEPAVKVEVAHAVLKGDKMDAVIRDAVMLGAAAIRPIVTERSETTLAALRRAQRVERWRRVAVASAKQCGRAVVPDVLDPCAFGPDVGWFDGNGLPEPRLALVEPGARPSRSSLPAAVARPRGHQATLLVGPEGGWAPAEMAVLEASCVALTLGPRTLRADAAAVVALAALFAVWGVEE
jgi:16S rRNA (uracil1498-N3)-methyltransferase